LDYSENMLARARAETADPAISYQRADLETVALPEATYRLVYSSLALHYITDIAGLFAKVLRSLRPGGDFVFSVEHPVVTATDSQEMVTGPDGLRYWPLTDYASEGERVTDWLAKGVIKQHRMVATYLNALIAAGFQITRLEEWVPTEAQIATNPDWAVARLRPIFLLVSAHSP